MAKRNLNLDKLPSNNLTKPTKIESVVTGKVKSRSGSGGLARDIRNIGNSLFDDVVMPAIKSAVVDFFSNGVNMMMFGKEAGPRKGHPQAYNRLYQGSSKKVVGHKKQQTRYVEEIEEVFDNVYFAHRDDANRVLGRMMERVAEYGVAKVGDYNSLAGLPATYSQESWGWDDLTGVRVHFTSGGFTINFPEPIYLD